MPASAAAAAQGEPEDQHAKEMALRIALRLAHLDAAREIQGWAVERMTEPASETLAPAQSDTQESPSAGDMEVSAS